MSKISKSPDRNTFQKKSFIQNRINEGRSLDEPNLKDMLKIFDEWNVRTEKMEKDPEWAKNNLEYDLRTTDWILEKTRNSKSYSQNLYAALCNMQWRSKKLWPTLKEENWGCSWRYAGGIIADMRQEGDYIDWYCSGIAGGDEPDVYLEGRDATRRGYVPEGTITEEIEQDLDRLGWIPIPYDDKN